MQMKTGVEQSVYAIMMLHLLPDKAVLPGEAISQQLGASPSYFQKLLRKLVNANLIISVPGVKGGFKLLQKAEQICVYDIYIAIEGQQSLFTASGVLHDLLKLEKDTGNCLLTDIMSEAESSWKLVLQRETIASLYEDMQKNYQSKLQLLQQWVKEHMVV